MGRQIRVWYLSHMHNTSLNSNVIPERMFEKDDAEKYLQAINHKNFPHAKS